MLIPYHDGERLVDVFWLRPDQVHVEKIASTLAKINRYCGRTPYPYSVAQHAVFVSHLLPENLAFEGLHHDDTEAYLGDIISPVKRLLPLFGKVENRLRKRAIAPAFGLTPAEAPEVKAMDYAAFKMEEVFVLGRRDLPFPAKVIEWPRVKEMVAPWHWTKARDMFLERHFELYGVEP